MPGRLEWGGTKVSERVLLHVGTPKTGTSHLQEVLFANRDRLAEAGICYPADRFDAQFLAALDLMGMPWGGLETEAVGSWDRLAAQVRAWPGTTIISHEILAAASRAHIGRALDSLSVATGTEIHILLSVRDLARQIPAEWQENVKHRSVLNYARFLEQIHDPDRSGRIGAWFWSVQEIPDIAARWGAGLPPERVHLITVPPVGSPPGLLWDRFVAAFSLGEVELDLSPDRSNPSLGVPETALLRRLNRVVNRVVSPADYRPLVRELLAHQTLSKRRETARLQLPPAEAAWADQLAARWVAELHARGYHVVGDLAELRSAPPSAAYVDPSRPREREVADAAVDALRALIIETARLRGEEARLRDEVGEVRAELQRVREETLPLRARRRVVRTLTRSRPGRALLSGYRVLRGSNSRSA